MPAFPIKRNFHFVIGCVLAGALLSAATPARAQQDESAPEVKFIDGVMSMFGLGRKAQDQINYRERSPLVLPQSDNLPPPEPNKITDANWPVDPEIKEARARAAAQKASDGRTSSQIMDDNSRPLLPSELERGRTGRAQRNLAGGERADARLSSSELGYKGGLFSKMFDSGDGEQPAPFTGEAARTSLVEPPPGYQTPSPAQPYAVGKSIYRDKAIDPMDRTYQK